MYRIRRTNNKYIAMYLHLETFPADEFPDDDRNIYWVVWDESDKPVGFCIVRPVHGDKDTCFLSRAGLLPCARGNGLHKRMINTRIKWAKKNKYKYCITYTIKNNFTSYNNLQNTGFKLYEPDYYYAGEECLYWRKAL